MYHIIIIALLLIIIYLLISKSTRQPDLMVAVQAKPLEHLYGSRSRKDVYITAKPRETDEPVYRRGRTDFKFL